MIDKDDLNITCHFPSYGKSNEAPVPQLEMISSEEDGSPRQQCISKKPPRSCTKTFQDKIPNTPTHSINQEMHGILRPPSPSVKHLKSMFQHEQEVEKVELSSKKKVRLSGVQAKTHMFEKINQNEKSIKNPTMHWKKTWKSCGNSHGRYQKQMWDTRGVAPKKSLNDLP